MDGSNEEHENSDLEYSERPTKTAKVKNQRPNDPENPEKTCLWGKDQGEQCSFVAVNDLHLYVSLSLSYYPSQIKMSLC